MRFIHTSDWHIGRALFERSLKEDQEYILQRFIQLVKDSGVDLVVIAGDVYDRAIPSVEAVQLLDWALSEIALDVGCRVFLISGNHDSADRLGFGSSLFSEGKLRIVSSRQAMLQPLRLEDEYGKVDFYGIPYFDPAQIRIASRAENDSRTEGASSREALGPSHGAAPEEQGGGEGERRAIVDHESALRWCVRRIEEARAPGVPSVGVSHAFVAGGEESESERPLSIGGSSVVHPSAYDPFVYSALGHLHRPQNVTPKVRYSGSLLPYSFDEAKGEKSISIVELGKERAPVIEQVTLPTRRKLRILEGKLSEILRRGESDAARDDYVLIRREDDGPILDPMGKIRPVYPNVLHVERLRTRSDAEGEVLKTLRASSRKAVNLQELFSRFFQEVTGDPLADEQIRRLKESFTVEE